jgi:hypothetical protein
MAKLHPPWHQPSYNRHAAHMIIRAKSNLAAKSMHVITAIFGFYPPEFWFGQDRLDCLLL